MQPKTMYGAITVLVALLVISSTLTAYYYTEYNKASTNNANLSSELASANSSYSALASKYNGELSSYNSARSEYNGSVTSFGNLATAFNSTSSSFLSMSKEFNLTFSLLVSSIAALNTSSSAYINASKTLTQLWTQYLSIQAQYKQAASSFHTILASFDSENNATLPENVQPVSISLFTANILIDFGNGTSIWYNNTSVEPQWNLYVATLVITQGNVNATYYPVYGEHLVTGIEGLQNNNAEGDYWLIWTYNSTALWQSAAVGADQLPMYNGSIYAWGYCGSGVTTNPSCASP
jgi:hypothetical protein